MAVTQYVGARYVPLFADPIDWDSTKEYEPLTIVTYQGASYTSRQSVPAGVSITDQNYWVLTGNYNAQVEQYRQEVRQFDGRIAANASAIATLDENLDSYEETTDAAIAAARQEASDANTATNAALSEFQAEVTADYWVTNERIARQAVSTSKIADGAVTRDKLAATINPYSYFTGYNAVFIGDSYTYGTGASDHLSGDANRFSSVLATKLNMTEFNFGVGSTGFCDPGSGGQNAPFSTQVTRAVDSMSATEKDNTHLVVIAGGVNDFNEGSRYGASDMQTGAHDAVRNAVNGFPNAIVLVVPMLFKGNEANPRLLNFESAIINGVLQYNGTRRVAYISGAWTWNFGRASHYISDQLHPNDTGHKTIANRIYTRIMGGESYDNFLLIPTWESGYSGGVDQGTYWEFYNGRVCMYGNYVTGTAPANTTTKICQMPGCAAPNQTVYGIITKSGQIFGAWQITPSGAIYVRCDSEVTDFYLQPVSYIPKGILS